MNMGACAAAYLSVAMSFHREVLTRLNLICRTVLKLLHTHVDNTVRSRLNAAFGAGFLKRRRILPRRYRDNDEVGCQPITSSFLHLHLSKSTVSTTIIFQNQV